MRWLRDPAAGRRRVLDGMQRSLDAAWKVLSEQGSALDAAVAAVAAMEDDGAFNAGRGSVPTADGSVEFDAAVMDGATGAAGGIAAATWPANPILVARAVAHLDGPVLLAGSGADRFAATHGFPVMDPARLTAATPGALSETGTVGAVAVDLDGRVAAATSTGGWPGQLPGRAGDSPILGAGTWADNTTAAVSATGMGEAFIKAGYGHLVDWMIRSGHSLATAGREALEEVARRGGSGGAIVLAGDGQCTVLFDTAYMARGWLDASGSTVKAMEPEDGQAPVQL
jgi:isoaspartyl peptidase/L-asparaginase-like protein (Ntn-hydrolase superfamily)